MKNKHLLFIIIILFTALSYNANAQYWSNISSVSDTVDFKEVHFSNNKNGFISGSFSNKIYLTNNGGIIWTMPDTVIGNGINAIHFPDSTYGYAAGDDGKIYKTTDGGAKWNYLSSLKTEAHYGICFTDSLMGYVVGKSGAVYKTHDGGASWDTLNSGTLITLYDVQFTSPDTGYVVGIGIVMKTNDGGNNWITQISGTVYQYKNICFTDENTGYIAASSGNIMKTTNGGDQWNNCFTGNATNHFKGIHFVDKNHGLAVGMNGIIYHTTDAGLTWVGQSVPTIKKLNAVYYINPDTAIVVGDAGTALINTNMISLNSYGIENQSVTVFPNPADNQINIEMQNTFSSKYILKIYNSNGNLVVSNVINNDIITVDIGNLKRGFYFVGIYNEDMQLSGSGKFIKE